mgnify:CR=1 FL=1
MMAEISPKVLVVYESMLAELKKRLKGNTADDMKKLLQRDIDEMDAKIKRLKAKLNEVRN